MSEFEDPRVTRARGRLQRLAGPRALQWRRVKSEDGDSWSIMMFVGVPPLPRHPPFPLPNFHVKAALLHVAFEEAAALVFKEMPISGPLGGAPKNNSNAAGWPAKKAAREAALRAALSKAY